MKRNFSLLSLAAMMAAMLHTGCGNAPDLTVKTGWNAYDSETYEAGDNAITMKARRPSLFKRCMERLEGAYADETEERCDNMMRRMSARGGSQ